MEYFIIGNIADEVIANRVFEIIQYNNETNIYLSLGCTTYGKVANFGNNVVLL